MAVARPHPRRMEALAFIDAEIAAGRPFPRRYAIARHMGWHNSGTVLEVLSFLAHDGHLVRIRDARGRWQFARRAPEPRTAFPSNHSGVALMKTMTTFAGALAGLALLAGPAHAESPATNWSGLYLGVHGGYAWTDLGGSVAHPCPACLPLAFPDAFAGSREIGGDGWHGGATAGANVHLGRLVIGIEADVSRADLTGGHAYRMDFDTDWKVDSKIDLFGTARGRLGMTQGNLLIYGTAGVAWARVATTMDTISITGPLTMSELSAQQWHVGWTAGGGVEWAFAPGWSFKGEYLYMDLGTADHDPRGLAYAGTPIEFEHSEKMKVDLDMHIVRAGLNYRF